MANFIAKLALVCVFLLPPARMQAQEIEVGVARDRDQEKEICEEKEEDPDLRDRALQQHDCY